ncbi:unnamed protein product [Moneuplotes crassus]|uniref:BZIP domain-containing protein n=1 Tax=Euplotes crassus TaxID=5936 RepID=A0AAD1XQJ3_EUPCR|nr:unnamed protein product [Moneuplotes crassus]
MEKQESDCAKKAPKSNKERSRQHRLRKKNFIERTLQECIQLKEQIRVLTLENQELRKSIKEKESNSLDQRRVNQKSQFEHPLHEYEDYVFNTLSKKIIANPEEVRYTELEQVTENICEWSPLRIDYIKTCFKKILDSMVCLSSRSYYACNSVLPFSGWSDNSNLRKRRKKYFSKSPAHLSLEHTLSSLKFSSHSKSSFSKFHKPLKQFHKKFKKIAQCLVKQRNKLFNLYQDIKDFEEKSSFCDEYTKTDVVNDFVVIEKIKDTTLVQNHGFYNISKKDHLDDRYQDAELTE